MGTASSGRPSEKHQIDVRGPQTPPEMPDDLHGDHAVGLWHEAVAALPHVLRPIDFAVLRLACLAYQKSCDLLDSGETKEAAAMVRIFEVLGSRIGLTPHARRVVKPVADEQSPEQQEALKFERWLAKGRRGSA